MKTHDLIQGSREWLAFRAEHFPASEAPAMLGESKYKTRTQLLNEKHTGLIHEVDAATQRRFDDGHRFESLARPLAEEIIGEPLSPVTGSNGELSASFDGITFMGDVVFEHKTLNDEIRVAESAAELGLHYRIQMEQQLAVSGAEKCLFMATKWNDDNELLESLHLWYYPDMALRQRIIDGWVQFAKDLAEYHPREITEKQKAESILSLPALAIQIRGEVTLSNLPQFKEAASTFIANINTELKTDADFAQAEETVKFCKQAEDDLEAAKKSAIGQTASIDELMRTIDHIRAQLRDKRLVLDKLVKTEKEAIKQRAIQDAARAYRDHVLALETEIEPVKLMTQQPDFAGAIKGKKTMSSMHNDIDTELANSKMAADAEAKDLRYKLAWLSGTGEYLFLFSDLQMIISKPLEDFKLLVETRIANHKQSESDKLEAERKRIHAEEEAKAQEKARIAAEEPAAQVDQEQIAPETTKSVPVANLQSAVIEHQDDISTFLKARNFGREENKIRSVLVEFVKWQAERA